jgi:hypothetical protein
MIVKAAGVRSTSSLRGKNLNHSSFAAVAFLEVIGNIILTIGLFFVGSGVPLIFPTLIYTL